MNGVFCLLLAAVVAASNLADDAEKFLLPGDISPVNYDLTLFTNIEKFVTNQEKTFVFSGHIRITIDVLYDNVTDVVLHIYNDIEIVTTSIEPLQAGDPRSVRLAQYDPETNKQSFIVSPPLRRAEQYLLTIGYNGRNTKELTGFYRSSYLVGITRRWLLVTDFESFGARRAFPCFDEPEYKATFQLTVNYNQSLAEDGYKAHFNTDVESEIVRNGRHITTFQKTALPLSTYLVAFTLSDFVSSPEPTYFNSSYNGENGTKPYRTIGQSKFFQTRQDLLSQVAGPAVLNFMTKKTRVGFGLNKVEQAGIPDFADGAMENWGLLTYRESLLFWNEQTGSTGQKQDVVTVTAHELAHQWFGNLVTLHWWSDLWLNEGFATFYEYHASDEIREPTLDTSSWDLIGQFVEGVVQGTAFYEDALRDARPLTSDAFDQDSVDDFFDGISYDKGGSVLRMWRHILGEDIFYDGLNRYLISQEEGVGTPEILLASWDGAIDALPVGQRPKLPGTVADLFAGWHLQPGYPVLIVTRQGGNLTITQERFLSSGAQDPTRYDVPISYSTDLENNFNDTGATAFLLAAQNSTIIQLVNPSASWIVLNNQATGYYRINYDQENWDALEAVLDANPDLIHPYNRAQIYDDSFSLFLSNYNQPISNYFRLLGSLRHERNLVVWRTALRAMRYLLNHLESHPQTYTLLKEYFSSLVEPTFNELSLYVRKEDSHTKKLLRADLAPMACLLGVPECLLQANHLFTANSSHPDVRGLVMCQGIMFSDAADWMDTLNRALHTDGGVRKDLLSALTCTKNDALLKILLELLPIDGRFTEEDKLDIMDSAAQGDSKRAQFALDLIGKGKVRKNYATRRIMRNIGKSLNTENAGTSIEKINKRSGEVISMNRRWLEKKQPEILEWLQNRSH